MTLLSVYDSINITTLCCNINGQIINKCFKNNKFIDCVVDHEKMAEKNENRRVRMTRRLMKDALLELLKQQKLSKITVKAICDTADVNRSTFYKYYSDTTELFKEIEQELLEQIPVPVRNQREADLLALTTAFFDFIRENENTLRILFSESVGNSFMVRMVEHLDARYILLDVTENIDESTDGFSMRLYL